jgi:hypothetical protein
MLWHLYACLVRDSRPVGEFAPIAPDKNQLAKNKLAKNKLAK